MTKHGKIKIGSNDPCPCGSGLKYKKCHCVPSMEQIHSASGHVKAMEALRQSQQGQGKPIISTEFNGYRFTAVGSQLHYSKTHKTFIDFLSAYILSVLSHEWCNLEIAKPLAERHQILKWYDGICTLQQTAKPRGVIQSIPVNGLIEAYYGLAYNLYLLQHNAELQDYLVRRLKQSAGFYAAYYETYVAAWFILAGFQLRIENEQDPTITHPEFIATRNGQSYSVEAKTRQPGKKHFDIGTQLYKGLCIEAHHPRIIFIDMNVGSDIDINTFREKVSTAIHSRESSLTIKGVAAPSAHVFVTNQPYHLLLNDTCLPRIGIPVGFKISDFGNGAQFSSYTKAYKSRVKYAAFYDVLTAMENYNIPVTFDGEIPEFAFSNAKRRFIIGERLKTKDETFVTIQSGIVVESEKRAYLVVNDDQGHSHIMEAKLSDAELTAYQSHPETFFGRVLSVNANSNNPIDLYEFFINSYKETPREKLLQFMNNAPDIDKLKKLADDELLFIYAERLTHRAMLDNNSKS